MLHKSVAGGVGFVLFKEIFQLFMAEQDSRLISVPRGGQRWGVVGTGSTSKETETPGLPPATQHRFAERKNVGSAIQINQRGDQS